MEQASTSLPRHIEIARNPEQHYRQRDMVIAQLKRDIRADRVAGYPKRKLTPGYGR